MLFRAPALGWGALTEADIGEQAWLPLPHMVQQGVEVVGGGAEGGGAGLLTLCSHTSAKSLLIVLGPPFLPPLFICILVDLRGPGTPSQLVSCYASPPYLYPYLNSCFRFSPLLHGQREDI